MGSQIFIKAQLSHYFGGEGDQGRSRDQLRGHPNKHHNSQSNHRDGCYVIEGRESAYSRDTLDKETIPVLVLRGTEQEGLRVHHATQNGMQLKTYELFTNGIFHLIFCTAANLG